MDVLQQVLQKQLERVPELLLEKLVSKKLRAQGLKPAKTLCEKIASHILSGRRGSFKYGAGRRRNVTLSFSQTDADEIERAVERFQKDLPGLLVTIAHRVSKDTLRNLESGWQKEYKLHRADISGFRTRLEERWGEPLGYLRMLLNMAREWGQAVHDRSKSNSTAVDPLTKSILTRLHVRACQVADEIICLLENGFADGAMARWRTLHEIAVVATVLSKYGDEITKRYVAHQAVESKRAMNKFARCYPLLGYKPLSRRAVQKIDRAYAKAIGLYGKDFASDYGWAAHHLGKRHSFADLEEDAGRAEMRSYYQLGNDNIHAGVKSMFVRLGLLDYDGMLAGRSNVGLMEPGQNAAHTLTQLTVLVCMSERTLDDLTIADMMITLRDRIPRSFARAQTQLRREHRELNRSKRGSRPEGSRG
jgi:hypothetical protein